MPKIEFNLPRLAALIPMLLWSLDIMSSGRVLPVGYIAAVMVLMVVLLWRTSTMDDRPQPSPKKVRTTMDYDAEDAAAVNPYRMPDQPRARRGP